MGRLLRAACAFLLAGCALPAAAETLRVGASHALAPAMADIATTFQRRTGHALVLAHGNSAALAAGDHDVLLVAGDDAAQQAQVDGLAAQPPRLFAEGRLVAMTTADFPAADWQQWVRHPGIQHVALIDPQRSAHGQEARNALASLGVIERLRPRLLIAADAPAALALLREGKAQLAILPMALARTPLPGANVGELPEESYRLLPHYVVPLQRGTRRAPAALAALQDFLFAPDARDLLRRYGYRLP